ncbi:MAG TPA: hypothetical protein VGM51_10785 [Armatimonadota bacterium]|jgi:hypothetical protein
MPDLFRGTVESAAPEHPNRRRALFPSVRSPQGKRRQRIWFLRALLLTTALILAGRPAPRARAAEAATATYRAMLKDYIRYAETLWHDAPGQPGMGYWGTGRSDWNNEGIRAVSTTAVAYAYLYRRGDHVSARIDPALRWCAETHVTGPAVCTDGKHWGNSWQSAMWAGNVGVAAFLVKDALSPETMAAVKRCVAAEADRFNDLAPPNMATGDTKAEENAWDLTAASSALLLMPEHPHSAMWRETVSRWGFNTLSCSADKYDRTIVDGKRVCDWVTTAQVFDDFTLENHGIFHPVYAMVGPATNAQAAVAFRLADRPVPGGLKHSVLKGWGMLRYIVCADGEWLYPQGLDWDLHDYEHIHYFAMLATLYSLPEAALLERRMAGYARRRQLLNGGGRFVGDSGNLGFAREAVQAERITFAAMMHEQFGEPKTSTDAEWGRMVRGLTPAKAFDRAGFVVHRTPRGLTSFSWNHQLMGLALPESAKHLDRPYVTTPWQGSLVGRFTVDGQSGAEAARFKVLDHTVQTDRTGFAVTLDAEINDGALRQKMAVLSVAPGVLAYVDRVTAMRAVVITLERGLPIAIENDDVSGGSRQLTSGPEKTEIKAGLERDVPLIGNWANVDGRLGLVSLRGSIVYRAAGKPNRPGAREDILFGSYDGERRAFKTGDIVSERAGLILLDGTVRETAALAKSARVTQSGGSITLTFKGPDGKHHTLSLKGGEP